MKSICVDTKHIGAGITIIHKLQSIPLVDLLLVAGLALVLLLAVCLVLRRRRISGKRDDSGDQVVEEPHLTGPRFQNGLLHVLRLTGFGALSFIFIGGGVMLYKDYQQVSREIAPTPNKVQIPGELEFEIETVSFNGGEGQKMAGWFVKGKNGATIILLHGYGGNRKDMLWHAQRLAEEGFGVLLYDERASGESEGDYRSYGWQDATDVGGALAYLNQRSEVNPEKIGIAGCSIGGQIALQGGARYPQIRAVWADGPAAVRAIDNPPPENWATAIGYLSNFILDWMYTWRLDIKAPMPMIESIGEIAPRPIMLVGGGQRHPYYGNEIPRVNRYAEYAGDNAQVWIIGEAYHCDGPQRRPEEYAERMVNFFKDGLGLNNQRH